MKMTVVPLMILMIIGAGLYVGDGGEAAKVPAAPAGAPKLQPIAGAGATNRASLSANITNLSARLAVAKTNLPAVPAATSAQPSTPDTYKLVPQDRMYLRIEEDPAESIEPSLVTVTALGEASFPVSRGFDTVITLTVRGKTLGEVKAELKARLDADYYQDAHLNLQLVSQSQRMGKAQIYGAFRGVVQLPPLDPKTVTDALIEGGYPDYANLKKVTIHRLDPLTKKDKPIVVDVQRILDTGDRSADVPLQDGDRIEVVEKTIFFR
jgi:protein involved in polysaccharide export with SLBB domain